jgi:O-acetylserine/cysteine efflux transporter
MTPRDIALAAFVSVIWGLAFVAMRFGLEGFTAPQLTALRFLIASIPVLFVNRPAVPWHLLVLIGLSLFAGQFLLLFLAFRHGIPPGLASVTQQTHVFLTVLLATLLFGERPTARQGLGMTLAAAGLVLIGLTVGADLPALALALALSGALSWAVGNLLLKHVRGVPMFPLIAWCSLVPPLPMLLLSALWGEASLPAAVAGASWVSLGAALFLGAATSAYAIWGRLLGRYPAAVVAPLALLSPVTGVVVSALVFGERFTSLRYAGMALILAGLAVIVLRAPNRTVTPLVPKME